MSADRESQAARYVRAHLDQVVDQSPAAYAPHFKWMVDCALVERSLGWEEVRKQGQRADRAVERAERAERERDALSEALNQVDRSLPSKDALLRMPREQPGVIQARLAVDAALSADAEATS